MALPQRSIGKSRHRMVLLALTAITLLSLDLSGFGPIGSAQRFVRDLLHPVTEVAGAIVSPFADAWNAVFDYDDLEAENEALTARVQELEGNALSVEAEREAFRRLLEATEITYVADIPTQTATVVRGAVGNFDADVITIDKGTDQGIRPGMAVVTAAGLVGRVDRADGTTATVQLLSDPSLVVGVRLASTDDVGLGSTVPGEPGRFRIDKGLDWPEDDNPALLPVIDTVVVTAASSRYPAEIPTGRIVDVRQSEEDDGLSMIVDVALSNDVTDLGFVTVLLAEGVDQVPLDEVVPSTIPLPPIEEADDSGEGVEP